MTILLKPLTNRGVVLYDGGIDYLATLNFFQHNFEGFSKMEIRDNMFMGETPCKRNHPPLRYKSNHYCVFCAMLNKRWRNMIDRCHKPDSRDYPNYGARGIRVCERWRESFDNWYEDIGQRITKEGISMDRIDNDGDYTPDNVRLVNAKVQNRNKRTNVMIEYDGVTKALCDWAKELGKKPDTISSNIKKGRDVEGVLFDVWTFVVPGQEVTILRGGRRMNLKSWCKALKCSLRTVEDRVYVSGWTYAQALGFAPKNGKFRTPNKIK